MNTIEVYESGPLKGEVFVQGSKNAALPVMTAAILIPGVTVLHNIPLITDILYMITILRSVGCVVERNGDSLYIDACHVNTSQIPQNAAGKMRSSIIFLGAMLARMHRAGIPYPGGCVIGKRPFDFHVDAMERMGAVVAAKEKMLTANVRNLHGADITLRFPSVGATESIILAAVLADGRTRIFNAAREPEIQELCGFLNAAGAKISGAGGSELLIDGVSSLKPVEYRIRPDRIVAGTYAIAIAATRGNAHILNTPKEEMGALTDVLCKMGCEIKEEGRGIFVDGRNASAPCGYVRTGVYPEFPTDLQSPLLTMLCVQEGNSIIEETVFEGRFRTAFELEKLGADICVKDRRAYITGGCRLHGAEVCAPELRGGAALVIAGLLASGKTIVHDAWFIDRGYADICGDLERLGAKMTRNRGQWEEDLSLAIRN